MNSRTRLGTNGEAYPKVKVFDFFSGCGGASRGFQDAGMEVVFALDWNADTKRTFKQNFPSAIFKAADIRQVKEGYVKRLVRLGNASSQNHGTVRTWLLTHLRRHTSASFGDGKSRLTERRESPGRTNSSPP